MNKVKFIIFASSLLVSVLLSSCNKQIAQASAFHYDAAPVTTEASEASPASYTWSAVSSENCGYALLADNLIATAARGKSATFPVIIEEANECHGLYRLVNPMKAFSSDNSSSSFNLIINATNPDRVTIEKQSVGVDLGEGEIEIESAAARHLRQGAPEIVVADAGLFGVCKDGEISFPDNNFTLWVNGKRDESDIAGSIRIILPQRVAAIESGIDKSDYSLGIEYISRTDHHRTYFASNSQAH